MEPHPPVVHRRPDQPRGAVLLLHGGRETGPEAPPFWNLPGQRMRPFARALRRGLPDTVVAGVRYRHRGWNPPRADAARDAVAALDSLVAEFGDLPVVLVGHSMGGRAALWAAGHHAVRGVVGLAAWLPPEDPVEQVADRRIVMLHSDRDRMTDPRGSWLAVARARRAGGRACGVCIPGSDHAMLRRAALWHALTVQVVGGLLDPAVMPPEIAAELATDADGGPAPGPHRIGYEPIAVPGG
ncbi:alpha/beta hydrolase [Streptomyces lonarensis]|uniref:alpha/beta hydrolase n=1 Tax=Streptomyces lonarensis TaxID=700599 RepID=UPI0028A76B4B|nr:alpha/beta hydrolase [Streptomyces lonarensis]